MSSQGSKKRKSREDVTEANVSLHKKQRQSPAERRKQTTNSSHPSAKCVKSADKTAESPQSSSHGFFTDLILYILKAGLGKARAEIFSKQVSKFSGKLESNLTSNVTHLVVDEQMDIDRLCRILKIDKPPLNVKVVKASWISCCLSEQKLMPTEEYELSVPQKYLQSDVNECKSKDSSLKTDVNKPENAENKFLGEKQNTEVGENKPPGNISEFDIPSTSTTAANPDNILKEDQNKPEVPSENLSKWTSPSKKSETNYDSDDSSYVPSDDDDYQKALDSSGQSSSNASTPNTSPTKLPKGNWVCARPSSAVVVNHNQLITDKLEVLLKAYENTRDRWRALSYKKAISALKRHPKEITSWEEANSIPGIGKALADKVWEIARTGHLRKIDHVCKGEEMEALNLFNNIWGVGPTVAQEWVQQGLRTLDDVSEKAKLNKQQKIGMKHYDDFLDRMPRAEAAEIEKTVREMAKSIHPDMLAVVCGSFRRGKTTCGDVDVLISHPDNKSHKGVLTKILDGLKQKGFITDDLIHVEEVGEQRKYMGVCKLPGENTKFRRLDIIVAPYSEYPCALLHFTGSGHFNRSMRALAKKKGMSLSEHALCTGVVRSGTVKIHQGTPLPVTCEQDVFRYLGLEYREPEERDH